jgi:hypothetical protein
MDADALAHVHAEVAARVAAGQVGVYTDDDAVISPIGVVRKSNGKLRTIHHLSFPRSGARPSIDAGIAETSLRYESLDDLFQSVADTTPDTAIWKVDLKDAFRHCAVAHSERRLLCFRLDDVTYTDLTLPFGLRTSPFLFNLVAELLHWCALRLGLRVSHYLDDFFGASPRASLALSLFRDLASLLGLQVNPAKCCQGPVIEVLGIEVNVPLKRASITPQRKRDIILRIDAVLHRGHFLLQELQSIAGTLVFITRVCPTGKAFLRRLFDACAGAAGSFGPRRLPTAAIQDLKWWRRCLGTWDGITVLAPPIATVSITTDASGSKGAGGWVSADGYAGSTPSPTSCTDVFSVRLPRRHRTKDIIFKEAYAVLYAVRAWADRLAKRHVTFFVDNDALVHAMRSGSIRQSSSQALIRELFRLALQHHFTFNVQWLASGDNGLADALSRFDLQAVARFVPDMVPTARRSLADSSRSPSPARDSY